MQKNIRGWIKLLLYGRQTNVWQVCWSRGLMNQILMNHQKSRGDSKEAIHSFSIFQFMPLLKLVMYVIKFLYHIPLPCKSVLCSIKHINKSSYLVGSVYDCASFKIHQSRACFSRISIFDNLAFDSSSGSYWVTATSH